MKIEYKKAVMSIMLSNKKMPNPNNPLNGSRVDDGYYGLLSNPTGSRWEMSNPEQRGMVPLGNYDTIVFILESPHIDEFNSTSHWPLANAKKYFSKIDGFINAATSKGILSLNSSKTYQIYFINPIQYQCSLGEDTELYRDLVFLYYWNKNNKDDFIKRLSTIFTNTNIICIFNACTEGSHKRNNNIFNNKTKVLENIGKKCGPRFLKKMTGTKYDSLNDMVNRYIVSKIKSIKVHQCHHPAAWIHGKFF